MIASKKQSKTVGQVPLSSFSLESLFTDYADLFRFSDPWNDAALGDALHYFMNSDKFAKSDPPELLYNLIELLPWGAFRLS